MNILKTFDLLFMTLTTRSGSERVRPQLGGLRLRLEGLVRLRLGGLSNTYVIPLCSVCIVFQLSHLVFPALLQPVSVVPDILKTPESIGTQTRVSKALILIKFLTEI